MDTVAENIIHTSHQKFKNFGIRSISVDDICNELHISKKTFYSRFPQKECLIEAVLDYESQVSTDNFEKTYKNKNAIDALIIRCIGQKVGYFRDLSFYRSKSRLIITH